MLTILDFQITRVSKDNFRLDVCERGQSPPMASATMEYRLDFMAGFELDRLDYDRRNPRGRLELLRAYGARLYEKLFASPDVRRVWQEYRERAGFLTLCLRIHDDAGGLEALPWETLYDGEDFIAGGPTTEITRLPLGVEPQGALPAPSFPLRLLSFASSPLDLKEHERLNIEFEQEILLHAVNDPVGQGRLTVEFEDEARREILENSLTGDEYHILHYTGHGISPQDGGGLLFEGADGKGKRISPEDFLASLDKAKGSLRLAVISGCNTARTLYTGGFRDLARGILARGVSAVAAMQFSLSDLGGLKFAEIFYPKLITGEPLEIALNAARRALRLAEDPELKHVLRADAFAPVLLAASGECLRATKAAEAASMPREAGPLDNTFYLSTLPRLGFGFYGRRREYRKIRDGFTQRNCRAVLLWGVGGVGKTALVSHIADRLYHHRKVFSGVFAFDCRSGALSVERILLDLHRYLSFQGVSSLEPLLHQSPPPEMAANFVGQLLSQLPLLVIFDNFEDLLERAADQFHIRDENLRTFITTLIKATPSGSRFLFTTRHLFNLGDSDVLEVSIGDLSRPEALYLMQRLPGLGQKSHRSKIEVLERFGGHPFSLVMADKHYCQVKSLDKLLDKAGQLHTEIREYLGIELNCTGLSDSGCELLHRLAAFRQPVPTEAAKWVMGEGGARDDYPDGILSIIPQRTSFGWIRPEPRAAPNLESEIRELIEWGLLTPVSEDGVERAVAVHSLVREFCRDVQAGERWRERLRDAAAFYTNFTQMIPDERKDPMAVWAEMEAFELLMEAEEHAAAADLLERNGERLGRWGFDHDMESRYRRVIDKLSGEYLAVAMNNLAVHLQARGKYGEALKCHEEALRINKELDRRKGIATSLHQIGVLHVLRGEHGEALKRHEEALRISKELDYRVGIANSLHEIGILYYLGGEHGEALKRYEEALRINKELDRRNGIANLLHEIGIVHKARGEHGEALKRHEEALRISKELDYRVGIARSLYQVGMLYHLRGEHGNALQQYEQSLRIAEDIDDLEIIAGSLYQIGRLHLHRGKRAEALQHFEQAWKITKELRSPAQIANSLAQLGALVDAGLYEDALLYLLMVFKQMEMPYALVALDNLSTLRAKWGERAFDAAWRAATGEDTPAMLVIRSRSIMLIGDKPRPTTTIKSRLAFVVYRVTSWILRFVGRVRRRG